MGMNREYRRYVEKNATELREQYKADPNSLSEELKHFCLFGTFPPPESQAILEEHRTFWQGYLAAARKDIKRPKVDD